MLHKRYDGGPPKRASRQVGPLQVRVFHHQIIYRGVVMSSTRTMRKSVLSIAVGLCLSSLAMAPVYAQSATGSVAGRANAGDQITLVNTATGASRT